MRLANVMACRVDKIKIFNTCRFSVDLTRCMWSVTRNGSPPVAKLRRATVACTARRLDANCTIVSPIMCLPGKVPWLTFARAATDTHPSNGTQQTKLISEMVTLPPSSSIHKYIRMRSVSLKSSTTAFLNIAPNDSPASALPRLHTSDLQPLVGHLQPPGSPGVGSLFLAAGAALGLLLASDLIPNIASWGLLRPPVAHAEALVGSLAAGQLTTVQPPRDVPLQRNEDPMTMQLPEAPPDLAPEELRAIRIFARNTPSVVNITNIRQVPVQNGYWSMDVQKVPAGLGSGFVWDDKGHIVTNYHVIKGADEVKVTLLDQSTYTARVVGGDADKDVAVLQLVDVPPDKMQQLQPVTLGSSAGLLVGQRVFAIGNPLGLEHTLTSGIVSGLNRELNTGILTIKGLVQTDAAINPGNSGGVLLDSGGRVIGINTAIADPTGKGASSGVGFALPIDSVKGLVEQILTYGRVLRPVLGVTLAPPQVLKQLGQPGVLVLEVPKASPAAAAGLKPTTRDRYSGALVLGDIITGIDGKPVRNYSDLVNILDQKRVGDTVEVDILRSQTDNLFASGAARRMTVIVQLGERGQVNVTE